MNWSINGQFLQGVQSPEGIGAGFWTPWQFGSSIGGLISGLRWTCRTAGNKDGDIGDICAGLLGGLRGLYNKTRSPRALKLTGRSGLLN